MYTKVIKIKKDINLKIATKDIKMNTHTIDGFNFDLPINIEQVKALAKFHRDQLHESLYHKNDKVGNIGITQRANILSFTKVLDVSSQKQFYDVYNTELKQLSTLQNVEEDHHEKGVNPVLLIVILACLAATLYFVFVHHIVPTT